MNPVEPYWRQFNSPWENFFIDMISLVLQYAIWFILILVIVLIWKGIKKLFGFGKRKDYDDLR